MRHMREASSSSPSDATSPTSEDSIGLLIKHVLASMSRMADRDMAEVGLTVMQWRPLMLIHLGKAVTAAELARLADVDTGAMTRTLDRLQAKGLLRRLRSTEDRRMIKLELTPQGREAAGHCPAILTRTQQHHLQGFSQQEIDQLRGFLTRMLANGAQPSG